MWKLLLYINSIRCTPRNRCLCLPFKQTGVNNANLITLTSTESRNGSTTARSCSGLTSAVTCVLLNTRSVCNKPATVKEHMIDQKVDLMFLSETWCKPNKSAVVNELTPPGYSFIGESRSSNSGGGVGLLYKSAYKIPQDYNQTI